jgi:hypothetical protein
MVKVRIYKPSKTAMQSGRGNTKKWFLEYELESPRSPESLIGWVSSKDTLNQVRLKFASYEDAVAYAESKGFEYDALPEKTRRVKPQNYIDNFKIIPRAKI